MTLIGVTGSMGSGKTTVANFFKEFGAHVINADKIVHGLYKRDGEIKKRIRRAFGKKVFTNRQVDRKKLAAQVFSSKKRLRELCGIVYPETIRKTKKEIKKSKKAINILDAPMLVEAGLHNYVDYVVVVRTNRKNVLRRCALSGFTKDEMRKRLLYQMPVARKLKIADFVVDNNRPKKYTREAVKKILEKIRRKKDG